MSAVGDPQMGTNMASPLDCKKVFFFLKIGFARRNLRDIAGIRTVLHSTSPYKAL